MHKDTRASRSESIRRHANVLVETYGIERALQIAQVNSTINAKDDYWPQVLEAVQQPEIARIVA